MPSQSSGKGTQHTQASRTLLPEHDDAPSFRLIICPCKLFATIESLGQASNRHATYTCVRIGGELSGQTQAGIAVTRHNHCFNDTSSNGEQRYGANTKVSSTTWAVSQSHSLSRHEYKNMAQWHSEASFFSPSFLKSGTSCIISAQQLSFPSVPVSFSLPFLSHDCTLLYI